MFISLLASIMSHKGPLISDLALITNGLDTPVPHIAPQIYQITRVICSCNHIKLILSLQGTKLLLKK